ncbi:MULTISPECIES: benzoate-CoA ligase family protein [Desulfococcus]|jgi:benzoate-CoA ligase|uniref:Benzoate-CoA ligase family n=2 Tax=Desulfococcus multivorans TaxID=897 RepID=S7VKC0_DESML|nr:benzoate-CoA ligase family protein [Desulfococcus multivorans]ACP50613.1 benzoate-CoA ligase [Desulfococcus multivorans]AOY59274.1 BclA: benzoate-CoA ligase [Desulfococcus multivorans]AQV01496.1 4-hydroxybenzoate--CoA ligase [Desulfococcus multivorans]EPR45018.1 benzoate-CoA ligase family [Desulfococcus multivorans DSM 2059]SKA26869.1 benzoate-CoA ligase [Desulfococcus multivorans DSM 2059]
MGFEIKLPEHFNAADYFVDRNIREGRKDKVAVVCEDRQLTYGQIQEGVNRIGNGLRALGVRMEERVALLLLDTEIYPQAFFGAIKIGAVPINLNTLMRPKDYQYFLNDSRARVLVINSELLENLTDIRGNLKFLEHVIVVNGTGKTDDIDFTSWIADQSPLLDAAPTTPDDACFWLYSSGSTGQPKGTVHLQHDMVFAAETYGKQVLQVQEDDRCFSAAKLFFAYGLGNGLYFPFSVGATAIYHPGRPTPDAMYDVINTHGATIFFGVPTLFGAMLTNEGTLGPVKICVSAGEALPPEIFKRWKERFGVPIMDGIGSTEVAHIFISNRRDAMRPGSTGKIVPGYEARIVDENLADLPKGEIGTLLIKGDSIAAYYWNKHEKTKSTMLGAWINTDDKFFEDEEGFFFYVGRSNDMLKAGGIWVSPIEVEACLMEHAAVLECGVTGSPDKDQLIKPRAFVVLNKGFEPSPELEKELKEYVKSKLAHYKYPRWIDFMEELPKTATGKIKRFMLKEFASK